jgi:hypothetical protein
MNTYNVILLLQELPHTFEAKVFPVMAETERDACLEAAADYITAGGDPNKVAKMTVRETREDGPARISKVPTLTGLQPVS